LYKLLQVDPAAEPDVIEAAFRRLARKYHPDVNPAPEARAHMERIAGAYEVLRDPRQRAAYDRDRKAVRPSPPRSSGSDEEPGLGLSLLGGLVGLDLRLRKRRR
jgi:curved DNA-binding protein CbpA